jgi:Fe-S oxidoreductase
LPTETQLFQSFKLWKSYLPIAAPGTSCRHQIKDGTKKIAKHPVEILYEALV